ncbi:MAG: 2-oxo acid dehydrogenase subunit E2 [Bdellovibrio sp.]|nr:MAG: 2-oxo acid dehydrogenase subunit E2 [Bdellovibrio sp.]
MGLKEVKLPDIGEGVTEGEMIKWLVKEGDVVEEDQPIAEVMTDKATVEVPTPFSGVVKELKVKEGDIVPIETTLLVLEESEGKKASGETKEKEAAPSQPEAKPEKREPIPTQIVSDDYYPPVANVLATPSTRRLARELHVDINKIEGTGLAGRVTREDVLKVASTSAPQQQGGMEVVPSAAKELWTPSYGQGVTEQEERVPLRGIRRKIAEQMQKTKHIVPHFTIMDEANVTELVKVRQQAKALGEQYGVKITYLPFVMKALIATLREFPMFNASIDDEAGEIVYKKYFHIGFAADTPNGLLVPVVKNADQKTLLQVSKEINELANKARLGKLSLEEMKGATISITNIGSVGGTYATPIINHPEVAIIGMYKIVDKPVMINGKFRAAKVMNFTATCDHRLIDGAVAANFLKAFIQRIEQPSQLMLDMI